MRGCPRPRAVRYVRTSGKQASPSGPRSYPGVLYPPFVAIRFFFLRPTTVQVSGEDPHPLCQPARSSTAQGERRKEPRGVETLGRNWRGQALLGRGAPRWRNWLQYER